MMWEKWTGVIPGRSVAERKGIHRRRAWEWIPYTAFGRRG
jgi:hypothetical protein